MKKRTTRTKRLSTRSQMMRMVMIRSPETLPILMTVVKRTIRSRYGERHWTRIRDMSTTSWSELHIV